MVSLAVVLNSQGMYIFWRAIWIAKKILHFLGHFDGPPRKSRIFLAFLLCCQENNGFPWRLGAKKILIMFMYVACLFSLKHIWYIYVLLDSLTHICSLNLLVLLKHMIIVSIKTCTFWDFKCASSYSLELLVFELYMLEYCSLYYTNIYVSSLIHFNATSKFWRKLKIQMFTYFTL